MKIHIISLITVAVCLTSATDCHKKTYATDVERYASTVPNLETTEDSVSFFYGVVNGEGFMKAVINNNTGYLKVVDNNAFISSLKETLTSDSMSLENLTEKVADIDNLQLPQPELSSRFGILAGLSAVSYTKYYDIAWNADKIAEGYFHGMTHIRSDVLPGPLAQEEIKSILYRLTTEKKQ